MWVSAEPHVGSKQKESYEAEFRDISPPVRRENRLQLNACLLPAHKIEGSRPLVTQHWQQALDAPEKEDKLLIVVRMGGNLEYWPIPTSTFPTNQVEDIFLPLW